jgi:hypothetical protein
MNVHKLSDFIGGWIIGNFEPALLRTPYFEVGWKIHTRHEGVKPHLHREVTEYNLLAHGSATVNGVLLQERDLFILYPGERVDVEIHTEEIHVVCVKVPSIPEDKELCEQS